MKENQENKQVTAKDLSHSQRFTEMVLREYNNLPGGLALTDYQRELIQHYFVKTDAVLKKAEQDRLTKNEWNKKDESKINNLAVIWQNVNLDQMALDVVHYAKLGLDPTMKNHLHIIPYKNNKAQKYDMGFIIGYEGKQYVALEYALEQPTGIMYDLVYSNDYFKAIKRGPGVEIETYEHDIKDAFDRGSVVGGFFYAMYADPKKNKLTLMSKKDIEKRKPSYASKEFWGDDKGGGWYEEMCLKTVVRHGCDSIALDPKKVNASLLYVEQRNVEVEARRVNDEIESNANGALIDPDALEVEGQQVLPGVQ
jgi:recombination protein RecT